MHKKIISILGAMAVALFCGNIRADDAATAKSPNALLSPPAPTVRKSQSEIASKTAKFGKVSKSAAEYQSALDAHALEDALKQQNKSGAFKGTVTAVFEPRGGALAILNFDENYRKAMSALLRGNDFTNFPNLKSLVGKEVWINGKFLAYQGRIEVVLTNVAQVKLVEGAK